MKAKIQEAAAFSFTKGFYDIYRDNCTIQEMFDNAKLNMSEDHLRAWNIPELNGNGDVKFEITEIPKIPPVLKFCIEDERNPDFERVNAVYIKPKRFEDALVSTKTS